MKDILFLLDSQGFSSTVKFSIIVSALIVMVIMLTLKGFSLWYASKHNDKGWFIAILLLNTLGLLEIVYLFFFERDKNAKNFFMHLYSKIVKSN